MQQTWFVLIAILFTGYFVLEGFDFGVGMLMPIIGHGSNLRKRVLLNTIGPVWDGNEVWLITAGGTLFAAFPEWYASMFSGFYLALLLLLFSLILRVCAIEYRGKINDPKWRQWADVGIYIGSYVPALAWGWVFANLVRGVPLGPDKYITGSVSSLLSPYALLGALATCSLFLFQGAVYLTLKTSGEVRDSAMRIVKILIVPTALILGGFALWTQIAYGKGWTWAMVAVAVLGLVVAFAANAAGRDGWAFVGSSTTVVGASVLLFGSLFPNVMPSTINPDYSLTLYNASSGHYTLVVMFVAVAIFFPFVLIYQGWAYWVFRGRIGEKMIPPNTGLPPMLTQLKG
ncbi:cytochrome D ubiquinol oxidase subunit II [Nocardia camponoti]|uniref:Cytochrome D ubiquinol oxidase subunit II n=2 Tax=Nocardia camponoti TaxID=1616106 RepID=A0A917QMS0_9NOCA|nr:cytochrome D ubiquinol oxidase subunit II [Nocardia camponoti]